jgi:hypothetical protein
VSSAIEQGDPRGPLDLLRAVGEAEEVLILSYTANLDYFERFVLSETRRMQAIATIISDPSMLVADPLAVSGAGLRYTSAFARCPGGTAFHPKLIVIAGHDHATVAVGSGNMTLAGWHSSEEIWTYFHAEKGCGPDALRGVSRLLRQLTDGPVQVSSGAIRGLERTADLLDGLDASEPGPELVSSLDGPIIESLAAGPVDELILYSPFYDSDLSALRAVHERLNPDETRVFVQNRTSVDGDALTQWAKEKSAELLWCPDGAYRHGKLIEWSVSGERVALTGSPNLSAPALLLGIGNPGRLANCEIALIGAINESMAPPEISTPTDTVNSLRFSSDVPYSTGAGIVILGATLTDQGDLRIELADALVSPAKLQVYDETREWVSFPEIEDFPAGLEELPFPGLSPGTAIRLMGEGGASNEAFVSDPRRAQRKPVKRVGPDIGDPEQFVEDGDLNSLYGLVDEMRMVFLKSGYMVARKTGSAAEPSSKEEVLEPAQGQTLADYLSVTPAVLPDSVVAWSLNLPPVPGLGNEPGLEGETGMLTTETDDSAADSGEPAEEAPRRTTVDRMQQSSDHRRRQLRRFCDQALSVAAEWPNLFRALIGKFVLSGIAADLWPDETERAAKLLALIEALARAQDKPNAEEHEAISCYLAMALAILRSDVARLSVQDEANLRFKTACRKAARFDFELDSPAIERAAEELKPSLGEVVSPDNVLLVLQLLVKPKIPAEAAIDLIRQEEGIEAHEDSGVIVVEDRLPASFESQLLRLAALIKGPKAVIRAETERGASVACVWKEPFLLITSQNDFGRRGQLYKGDGASPCLIAAGWDHGRSVPDNLPSPVASWMPNESPPPKADPLLRQVWGEPSSPDIDSKAAASTSH